MISIVIFFQPSLIALNNLLILSANKTNKSIFDDSIGNNDITNKSLKLKGNMNQLC